jgi:outer membrane protein assembly factor BamB
MLSRREALGMLAAAGVSSAVRAADWTQYRGPNVDGTVDESIATAWPKEGPKILWKVPIGESFGSFAVAGGKAIIFVEKGGDEVVRALDANTGKTAWETPIDKTIFEKQGGNGPRSTPTIDGNAVFVLGTKLKLACLNATTGQVVWKTDLAKEYGGQYQLDTAGINNWGSAASPMLYKDLIFVNGGGKGSALLGIDKKTGKAVWKAEDDLLTHSSPVPAVIHGIPQVIFFTKSGLVSVVPETGKVLWRFAVPFKVSTASSPIVWQDIVYCSAGYNNGAHCCRILKQGDKLGAQLLWELADSNALANHWTTPVCKDGKLYGIYGFKDYTAAPLQCVDITNGKVLWSQPGFGTSGGTVLVGNYVLAQTGGGPIVLVEATPAKYTEIARAQPIGGAKFWTMAVVSGGRIYMRNTKEAACLDVKA